MHARTDERAAPERGLTRSASAASRAAAGVAWFLRPKPLGAIGGTLVVLLALLAIAAPLLTPYDPVQTSPREQLASPSASHPIGTDQLGRDLWSRILFGSRISLALGFGAVAMGTFAAIVIGIIGGYYGGAVDAVIERFVDAIMAFPWIMLMMAFMAMLGTGIFNLMLALAIAMAPRSSRVVRATVRSIKASQYVEAATATGCTHVEIIFRHILPNVISPVIVLTTMYLGWAILVESALSFIGFGVPPPFPSWGRTLSDEGRRFMLQAPWIAIFPGVAISLAVFGFNMLGDALRDVLDPRMRGTQ